VADKLFVIVIVNVAMTSIVMLVMTVSLQFRHHSLSVSVHRRLRPFRPELVSQAECII